MMVSGSIFVVYRSGNKVSKVDRAMLKLTTLERLYLSQNRLHELPTEFDVMTRWDTIVYAVLTMSSLSSWCFRCVAALSRPEFCL